MEKHTATEKRLQQILEQREFSQAHPFLEENQWSAMTSNERKLLALLLLTHGEHLLLEGNSEAISKFDSALKIAPDDPAIFYRLGQAYLVQSHNSRCLIAACQAFKAAVRLDGRFCDSWIQWGCALTALARLHSESTYLQEALEKFEQAHRSLDRLVDFSLGALYWHWGSCWFLLGKYSSEALELNYALQKFRQAADAGLHSALFAIDHGNAILEIALLIGRSEALLEAIELYRSAIKIDPTLYLGWYHLGYACQKVFEISKEDAYYDFAFESYQRAAEINPEDVALWTHWGSLLLERGKIERNLTLYQQAYDKFEYANLLEENNHLVLQRIAQVQMLWGAQEERLDLLRSAEAKIIRSLQLAPDEVAAWVIYGRCLHELGDYFEDGIYYLQALEKFSYALTLNEKEPLLWYGLALTTYALGELNDNLEMIEKAITYYAKVEQLGGGSPQVWNDWGIALIYLAEASSDESGVEAAIEKFAKALGCGSEETVKCANLQQVGWLYNYGCAFDFLGRLSGDASKHEKAIDLLQQALEYNPSFADARYNLALAYRNLAEESDELEHYHKALEHYQILVHEEVEDDMLWHDYAMTLMTLADVMQDPFYPERSLKIYEQAEDKLHHAIALGHPEATYTLACLYSVLGRTTASMHFIERCQAAGSLPSIDELMFEDWLHNVRQTAAFKSFISLLSSRGTDRPNE